MHLDAIRTSYRRYARVYDLLFGFSLGAGRKRALEIINELPQAQEVLEIGVGTGLSLPRYRSDHCVTGVDLSEEMLMRARRRVASLTLGNVRCLQEMDAQDLAFEASSFSVVVAMYVLSVAPHPVRVLGEMARVCRPGGRLLIVNHFSSPKGSWMWRLERHLSHHADTLGWHPDFPIEGLFEGLSGVRLVRTERHAPLGLFTVVELHKTEAGELVPLIASASGHATVLRPTG